MTHLEEDPNTMNSYDRFWRHAMRSAYQPLNAIEQAALLPLQVQWAQQGTLDRYWALVPVLGEDGAERMLTLTVDRVEAYADVYRSRYFSINASKEPTA